MSRAAEAAMAASYKSLKEDFVSNLTGGTVTEINLVTAVAPVAVILWSALQSKYSLFKPYTPLSFQIDFLLNVGAILLATTIYSNHALILLALLSVPAAILYILPRKAHPKPKRPPPTETTKDTPNPFPKKPFLTTYRGCMMVVTCLAILAVDFRIFPRRFAKVENWGSSLMDVGVGSFVFSAGVVAARPILKEAAEGKSTALSTRLYRSIRHSLPLLVLGFIRLWSVKGLDYAEHVTEYGVHWNFFFTLGFLPPFLALFQSAFAYVPSFSGLAVALGVAYQAALEFTSLKAYILTAPRVDLLSQNREGVFSFFGYLAIFLAGQSTGMVVIPRGDKSSSGFEQRRKLLTRLSIESVLWITLTYLSTDLKYGLNLSISRRLANLPYFLWIAAFNSTQITAFCIIETVFFPATYKTTSTKTEAQVYKDSTSRVLEAYNRNGLAVFLVANLLTGLVNLSVPTLHVADVWAMGILLVYAGVVTGLAVGLDAYDVSVKL